MTRQTAAPLGAHEQWFKPGAEVAIIERISRGHERVERATVDRVTAAQIITTDGRRFWRRKCGMALVGRTDQRNGGMRVTLIRITPIDCTAALRYFAANP